MSSTQGFSDIQVIGFDLDQTLYPKSPQTDEAIQQYLYEQIAELHNCSTERAKQMFTELYRGGEGLSGGQTMRQLGFEDGGELVQTALEKADIASRLIPDGRTVKLLGDLGCRYGNVDLITGSSSPIATQKLDALEIPYTIFNHLITDDVASKSSGEAYELWLGMYRDIDPKNFLYIGDRFKSDFVIPREYGIAAVIVNAATFNSDYDCLQLPDLFGLRDYLL